MKNYQDSLEDMNNAAVEYVRGIAVVKAFSQTIRSFRKFHETITKYGKFCLDYTMSFELTITPGLRSLLSFTSYSQPHSPLLSRSSFMSRIPLDRSPTA
ncbi:MAG: hypothetical protein LBC93_05545 [Synergistaceae bacterium]|jgi:ABC-type multidrug transport system fused ATPase/permease subunit|nr:hypothetical protein [Synergistaceae bacterium]